MGGHFNIHHDTELLSKHSGQPHVERLHSLRIMTHVDGSGLVFWPGVMYHSFIFKIFQAEKMMWQRRGEMQFCKHGRKFKGDQKREEKVFNFWGVAMFYLNGIGVYCCKYACVL